MLKVRLYGEAQSKVTRVYAQSGSVIPNMVSESCPKVCWKRDSERDKNVEVRDS